MTRLWQSSIERARRTVLSLKQACYHAVQDYPGGATAIAAVDGNINATTLSHKLSLTGTNPKHKLNVDELQLILDLTRDSRIVDALLSPIGWVGIDVSELSDTDTEASLLTAISQMLSDESRVTMHLSKSLADGRLDDGELDEFELLALRLVQAVYKLRAVVRQRHADDVGHG